MIDENDAFNRTTRHTDLGGHVFDYTYGRAGWLTAQKGSGQDISYTFLNSAGSDKIGLIAAHRVSDLMGRVTNYTDYKGTALNSQSNSFYDADSRLTRQTGTDGSGKAYATSFYYYAGRRSDGKDDAATTSAGGYGELAHVDTVNSGTTITNWTHYEYWDEAKQKELTTSGSNPALGANDAKWQSGLSSFDYDVNGHVKAARSYSPEASGKTSQDSTFKYATNAQGMILRRDQIIGNTIPKWHRYLYANGATVGDIGNEGDSVYIDYAQQLARTAESRKDMYKNWKPIASADFDQNYQPINASYPGATSTTYVAKTGDTLYSIAAAVWGDSSLWYLIADANGLTATADLRAGQTLRIPNKVANIHNTSSTMRPYNAGAAMGDTSPTLPEAPEPPPPPAPKHGGCGVLGMIIVIIVAVVVTYITAGAASEFMTGVVGSAITAGGAAVGAAVGSIASHLVGMGLGMQDKFSWGAVAVAAVGGAATVGMSGLGEAVGATGKGILAVNAAAANIATQGASMLLGQQNEARTQSCGRRR